MKYNIKEDFKKLEEAGIDSSGLNINVIYSQNLHDFFIGDNDAMKYVDVAITIENHIYKGNEESTEKYGVAYGKLFTTYDEMTGRNLNYMDVIDSIDQDTFNCLSVFMESNSSKFDDDLLFEKFFYVDRLIISKNYRGSGLGSILLEYIKYKFADILTAVVLQPLAFEQIKESVELFEQESEHISHFYKRHGFKKYRDRTWVYHES